MWSQRHDQQQREAINRTNNIDGHKKRRDYPKGSRQWPVGAVGEVDDFYLADSHDPKEG
jgi:hypothetical protein